MLYISIVIPVYNSAKYICNCLESVAKQDYKGAIECICIDDCSQDNSTEIIESFISRYQGNIVFRLLRNPENKGVSYSRNFGMTVAKGDYVFFLDSDDEIEPFCISQISCLVQEDRHSFVVADFLVLPAETNSVYTQHLTDGGILYGENGLFGLSNRIWFQSPVNRLYGLNWIRNNGLHFEEGLYSEDNLWCFETAALAESVALVNAKTYVRYMREGSLSNSDDSRARLRDAAVLISQKMTSFIRERHLMDNFAVYNHYQAYTRISILNFHKVGETDRAKQYYSDWRHSGCYSKVQILRFSLRQLKSLVRDFHHYLPIPLGFFYLQLSEHFKKNVIH